MNIDSIIMKGAFVGAALAAMAGFASAAAAPGHRGMWLRAYVCVYLWT